MQRNQLDLGPKFGILTYPGEPHVEPQVHNIEGGLKIHFSAKLSRPLLLENWWVEVEVPRNRDNQQFWWIPHLTPKEGDVVDMHVFRTPAAMGDGIALIPDISYPLDGDIRSVLDLDATRGVLRAGLATTRVYDHILFEETHELVLSGDFSYTLHLLELGSRPFRDVQSFFDFDVEVQDLSAYVDHAYAWAYDRWPVVYQEFDVAGSRVGAPQFIVTAKQSPNYKEPSSIREACSIWFQSWFNALRTAIGTYRYAERHGNEKLKLQALKTKELALKMPQVDGLFYSVIAVPEKEVDGIKLSAPWSEAYFGNSNRNPLTWELEKSPFHTLDMSRTGMYLLEWYETIEKDPEILVYLEKYADKLMSLQDDQGFFPAWINPDTGEVMEALRQSPETASSSVFLWRLSKYVDDEKAQNYSEASMRSLIAVLDQVLPTSRWEDFETYWSCSRWGNEGEFHVRNAQYKQNSLSIFFLAEALMEAYEQTSQMVWIEKGAMVLDELLMFQSSYQPQACPVNVVGGFGVMNGDAELLDARQSLFAPLILKYAKILDDEIFFKRGLAALQSSFRMMYCPENSELKLLWEERWQHFGPEDYGFMMENFAHGGVTHTIDEMLGEFSIFDWGAGAAAEAYERVLFEKTVLSSYV